MNWKGSQRAKATHHEAVHATHHHAGVAGHDHLLLHHLLRPKHKGLLRLRLRLLRRIRGLHVLLLGLLGCLCGGRSLGRSRIPVAPSTEGIAPEARVRRHVRRHATCKTRRTAAWSLCGRMSMCWTKGSSDQKAAAGDVGDGMPEHPLLNCVADDCTAEKTDSPGPSQHLQKMTPANGALTKAAVAAAQLGCLLLLLVLLGRELLLLCRQLLLVLCLKKEH